MANNTRDFSYRHIGLKDSDVNNILHDLGYKDMETFLKDLMPESIYDKTDIILPNALDEASALKKLKSISKKNKVYKSYIGQGFYLSLIHI